MTPTSAMDLSFKLVLNQVEPYPNPWRYKRLFGKLNYFIVTHPNIVFAVNAVSQFLNSPKVSGEKLNCIVINIVVLDL